MLNQTFCFRQQQCIVLSSQMWNSFVALLDIIGFAEMLSGNIDEDYHDDRFNVAVILKVRIQNMEHQHHIHQNNISHTMLHKTSLDDVEPNNNGWVAYIEQICGYETMDANKICKNSQAILVRESLTMLSKCGYQHYMTIRSMHTLNNGVQPY